MLARLLRFSERAPKVERTIRYGAQEFTCREDKTLLDAALDAGVPLNYSCQVGACGTCRCRVLSGSFRTLKNLEYLLSADELASRVTLACQTLPESDLVLEVGGVTQPAAITSCVSLGDGIVELRLRPQFRVSYELGQFVEVSAPGGLVRPFSMVDLGDVTDGELAFHVKLRPQGAMSRFLSSQLGERRDEVRVSGAFGEIERKAHGSYERLLCLAGGSGLGVCASVARAMVLQGRVGRADFVTVSRAGRSPYHDRLIEGFPVKHRGTVTAPVPYSELFERRSSALAWVQTELTRAPDLLAVICGSSTLIEQGQKWLACAGVPSERVWVIPFTHDVAGAGAAGARA